MQIQTIEPLVWYYFTGFVPCMSCHDKEAKYKVKIKKAEVLNITMLICNVCKHLDAESMVK